MTLKITGVGAQFSGDYLVGTVRHSLSGGGSFDSLVSTAHLDAELAGGDHRRRINGRNGSSATGSPSAS